MKRVKKFFAMAFAAATVLTATSVFASAAPLKEGIGIVESSGLRLRSSASTDSTIISTAGCDDDVLILADYGDWYYVNYNLNVGYMSAEYLTVLDRENVALGTGIVNSYVNFRSTPDVDGEVISTLSTGTQVEIIGLNCGWYKVTCDGSTGYIRSDLVELTEIPLYNSNTGSIYDASASNSASSGESVSESAPAAESSAPVESAAPASSLGDEIVSYAKKLIGTSYVWGGTSTSGFDCSGYVQYVCRQFGISLNRTANAQMSNGYSVSSSNLQPGDLVFFNGTYATSGASHVGIYIGNDQFVHASSARGCVVISDLWSNYYTSHYYGARRVV